MSTRAEGVGVWRTAEFCGSDPARQSVGAPGHCEKCAEVGHVLAHPELGCGDVGCYVGHDEPVSPAGQVTDFRGELMKLEREVSDMLGTALYGWGDIDGVPHPAWGDHVAVTLAATAVDELDRLGKVEALLASGSVLYVWQWCWVADGRWNDLGAFMFDSEESARAFSDLVAERVDPVLQRSRLVRRVTVVEQLD